MIFHHDILGGLRICGELVLDTSVKVAMGNWKVEAIVTCGEFTLSIWEDLAIGICVEVSIGICV